MIALIQNFLAYTLFLLQGVGKKALSSSYPCNISTYPNKFIPPNSEQVASKSSYLISSALQSHSFLISHYSLPFIPGQKKKLSIVPRVQVYS